jgi:hypothetical protein
MSSLDTSLSSVKNIKKANAASEKSVPDRRDASNNKEPQDRGCRFWMVFAALLITGVLSAVEVTIISTALPAIVHNLNIGNIYAWIANSYFFTS